VRASRAIARWPRATAALLTIVLGGFSGMAIAQPKTIVYIEASTVNRWKLDEFPARMRSNQYRFDVLREYSFDKTTPLRSVLEGEPPRPDAVMLQECSTYFPGDPEAYRRMFRGWVDALEARGLRPLIATVVPPASSFGWWQDLKDFVKERVLGRPGTYGQVVAFNDWLRTFAAEREIPLLDLERVVRVSSDDRHMRNEYNEGDGTHLTPLAYERMDRALLQFLDGIDWNRPPR
jgi:hypothetical protein